MKRSLAYLSNKMYTLSICGTKENITESGPGRHIKLTSKGVSINWTTAIYTTKRIAMKFAGSILSGLKKIRITIGKRKGSIGEKIRKDSTREVVNLQSQIQILSAQEIERVGPCLGKNSENQFMPFSEAHAKGVGFLMKERFKWIMLRVVAVKKRKGSEGQTQDIIGTYSKMRRLEIIKYFVPTAIRLKNLREEKCSFQVAL